MASILRGRRLMKVMPENSGERCCVVGCSNRRGTDKKTGVVRSYHSIPKHPKRREQWIKAIPRTAWSPRQWDRVCSDHFVGGKPTRQAGSSGYIPSIFPTKRTPTPRSTSTAQKAGTELPSTTPKRPRKSRKRFRDDSKSVWETTDHDYIKSQTVADEDVTVTALEAKVLKLEEENESLLARSLKLTNIKKDDKTFQRYTGMPNYGIFKAVLDYLFRRCKGTLRYWRGADTAEITELNEYTKKPGPARKLDFEQEFYMTLVKVRTGKFNYDMAREMGVSDTLVSRIYSTWVNFLSTELKLLFEMKENLYDLDTIPPCFHKYKSLKVVIDCTELVSERASSLQARKETYSNYKSRDTIKFMVGLSPNMTVNYVSFAYGGRASDKHITLDSSSMLENLPPGSQVMADRGFRVEKELRDLGVQLIIPDFKGRDRSQLTVAEVQNSEQIAMARIHIERIIQRIRNYHILDSTMKLSQKDVIEQMFIVCSYLVNFQSPIIDLIGTLPSPDSEVGQPTTPIVTSVWDVLDPLVDN